MPDAPDFSKYIPGSTRFSLQDTGELAARLGSIAAFDRRGVYVWGDCFNRGMAPWSIVAGGGGGTVKLTTSAVTMGGYSCQITPGTTAGAYGQIRHALTPEYVTRIGIESAVSFSGVFVRYGNVLDWTGTDFIHKAAAYINGVGQSLEILDDTNTLVKVADIPISFWADDLYHTIKIVIDIITGYYVRLLCDNLEVDISQYKYNRAVLLNTQALEVMFRYYGNEFVRAPCYIGHTVITTNEP